LENINFSNHFRITKVKKRGEKEKPKFGVKLEEFIKDIKREIEERR